MAKKLSHRALSKQWPTEPTDGRLTDEAPVYRGGEAAEGDAEAVRRRRSAEYPERFAPDRGQGSDAARQAVGPKDPASGLVGVPAAGDPAVGEVALPPDVPVGTLVDLFLRSDRVAALPGSLAAGSFVVLSVEPQ